MARILIAEDDVSMRHFLAMALQRAGHDISSCSDGIEAMTLLEDVDGAFDLLLADIVMPGMDGIELSHKAKHIYPDLKVMFITGFAGIVMNNKAQQDNSRVLSKPFHLKDLVDRVEQALAGDKTNDPS